MLSTLKTTEIFFHLLPTRKVSMCAYHTRGKKVMICHQPSSLRATLQAHFLACPETPHEVSPTRQSQVSSARRHFFSISLSFLLFSFSPPQSDPGSPDPRRFQNRYHPAQRRHHQVPNLADQATEKAECQHREFQNHFHYFLRWIARTGRY